MLSIICIFAVERDLELPTFSGAFACLDMSKDLMASSKSLFVFCSKRQTDFYYLYAPHMPSPMPID